MKILWSRYWKENRSLVVFLCLMFVFRSAIADWNSVPTGSMKPTLVEGDRILINKLAYDIRVPFTHISLMKLGDPQRGDVVVFDSAVSQQRLVKRVIGMPGDHVEMRNNVLFINGHALHYSELPKREAQSSEDQMEDLLGFEHTIRTGVVAGELSSFAPVVVPQGAYLALGDNRDNSADSRVIGFIPRNEIVGRSKTVVMSLDYDNYFLPRSDRFFHSLQ
ncbi:signal peptidase I [Echinimonas agarilytica]|uniref:Signal peptidase I n=1 Tax=Echinimonas agarilytica TaxID=1215918 RepID=A0AA41W4F4_9GAMM|nr:signal peptidase I [Echinimonas agarilytica]MCM2678528.1 signal peptidase I [Echinimonas agarilytica]